MLDPREYAMFRVIIPGASDNDIKTFKDMAVQNRDAIYQKSVENLFQVSISANRETYVRLMKEDSVMSDAVRDLMREVFKDEFEEAEARGEVKGEKKGGVGMLVNLVKKGIITSEQAAAECEMTEENFKKKYMTAATV